MVMFLQPGDDREQELPAVAQRDNSGRVERRLDESMPAENKPIAPTGGSDVATIARDEDRLNGEKAAEPAGQVAAAPPAATRTEELSESSSAFFDRKSGAGSTAPLAAGVPPSEAPMKLGAPFSTAPTNDSAGAVGRASAVPTDSSESSSLALQSATPAAPSAPVSGRVTNEEVTRKGGLAKAPAVASRGFGGQAGVSGGALQSPTAPELKTEWSHQGSVIVVHVAAKPKALANNSLETVLKKRGINFENPPQDETTKLRAAQEDDLSTIGGEDVEAVFVEAPESTIVACLADLRRDTENFADVDIDVEAKLDSKDKSKDVEFDKQTLAEKSAAESPSRAPAVVQQQTKEKEVVALNRSRAIRLPAESSDQLADQPAARPEAASAVPESRMMRRGRAALSEKLERDSTNANNMQVLFIIRPAPVQQPAGPAAAKPAE
jgi:hypothetical protein